MWAVDYVAPHHLRRGQTMIAIESSSPANAGMTARPVIQVRSISAAVALTKPKLAQEILAAAALAPDRRPIRAWRGRRAHPPLKPRTGPGEVSTPRAWLSPQRKNCRLVGERVFT
jgi:hypothetical protein